MTEGKQAISGEGPLLLTPHKLIHYQPAPHRENTFFPSVNDISENTHFCVKHRFGDVQGCRSHGEELN